MFALPISMPRFKSIIFYQNSPKMKLFSQNNAKFSSAGSSALRPTWLQRLGALPPGPQWPAAAGGGALKPPNQPPRYEVLATWLVASKLGADHMYKQLFKNILKTLMFYPRTT